MPSDSVYRELANILCCCLPGSACSSQVLIHGTPLLSSTGDEFTQLDKDPVYQKMSAQVLYQFYSSFDIMYSVME